MAAKRKKTSGRAGDPVSLAPLTPDQALAGLLKVKPADVAKLEADAATRVPRRPADSRKQR